MQTSSTASNFVPVVILPESRPLAIGENGTTCIRPSSAFLLKPKNGFPTVFSLRFIRHRKRHSFWIFCGPRFRIHNVKNAEIPSYKPKKISGKHRQNVVPGDLSFSHQNISVLNRSCSSAVQNAVRTVRTITLLYTFDITMDRLFLYNFILFPHTTHTVQIMESMWKQEEFLI